MKNDKQILIVCCCCTKTRVYFLKKHQNCFILNVAIERTLFNCNTYQTCLVPQQAKSELHSVATKLQQILPLTDNFTKFKQFLVRIKATKGLTEPCIVMPPVSLLIRLALG